MSRVIEIVSTTDGKHKLLVGMNSNELASFRMMLWVTRYGERAVDFLQSLSQGFVSFMGGDIWVHNSDDVPRVNFFGEQKYAEVGIVANVSPTIVILLDLI